MSRWRRAALFGALACRAATAADAPWGRAAAESEDFTAFLMLVPDAPAVVKMWAKPAPPDIREYRTAEIGSTVTAMFAVSGGKAGADGRCNLVYRLTIAHEDGSPGPQSSTETLCSQRAPGPRGALTLGESAAKIVTDGTPRTIAVTATVTDRTTGKSVEVSAPLTLVPAGSLFHFESVRSLDDMQALIRRRFALGADRADVRRVFATEGRATMVAHPTWPGVEKYVYDIDLCSYYVWRWNISADYDARGGLRQAYVNGEIVFPDGTPARGQPAFTEKSKRFTGKLPRPEAFKGESSLAFQFFDVDGDPKTIEDQYLSGLGPTQPNPLDMGKLHAYFPVDPWRSIFDGARAEPIAQFAGDCAAADAVQQGRAPKK